jgi:hypothetical protein
MVENSGANNLIEAVAQLSSPLHRKLLQVKVGEVMFSLEFFGLAEVNSSDPGMRPPDCILGGLGCPAAGNENGKIFPVRLSGPEQMKVGYAFLGILPEATIIREVIDRSRVGITVVEIPDLRGRPKTRQLRILIILNRHDRLCFWA